jgi:hypothetical protein
MAGYFYYPAWGARLARFASFLALLVVDLLPRKAIRRDRSCARGALSPPRGHFEDSGGQGTGRRGGGFLDGAAECGERSAESDCARIVQSLEALFAFSTCRASFAQGAACVATRLRGRQAEQGVSGIQPGL